MDTPHNKIFMRGYAIGLSMSRMSKVDISRHLGINKSTVFRWISQFNNDGQRFPKKPPGRPCKTSLRSNRLLVRLAKADNLSSARKLKQQWREPVSIWTVYRRLRLVGLRKRRRLVCPLLTEAHKVARLRWAMTRVIWREVWHRVIFTDESRFKRIGSDARIMVWRARGERYLDKNVDHAIQGQGGSVHMWGAIWMNGRSRLRILRQSVNQRTYIQTLQTFYNEDHVPIDSILQDDNAPAHRAVAVRQYIEEAGIRTIPWPSRSPDLNPIEHVWDFIARKIDSRPVAAESIQQLAEWVETEWNDMPQDFVNNLILSMPRRIRATIEAKGGHTKY